MLKKKKKGIVVVISSPSGAGKSSIAKKLLKSNSNFDLSVSLTTREPRLGEIDGVDYKFVSRKTFQNRVKENSFIEYAEVFDNMYGTLKSEVEKKIKLGKNILLDIDWQGARQVKKKLPGDNITIFILPPSILELKRRLKKREHDNSFINKRMSKAKREINHWNEYDYVLVNDNINECMNKIVDIIRINEYKPSRQKIKHI